MKYRRELTLTILLILYALFLLFTGCKPVEEEQVCLKLYLVSGRETTETFTIPKGADIYVDDYEGTYRLEYSPNYVLKYAVIDFERIKCE